MTSNDTAIAYLKRCLSAADPATGHPLTGYERRLAEAELADREAAADDRGRGGAIVDYGDELR